VLTYVWQHFNKAIIALILTYNSALQNRCPFARLPFEIMKMIFDYVIYTHEFLRCSTGRIIVTPYFKKYIPGIVLLFVETFPKWRVPILELLPQDIERSPANVPAAKLVQILLEALSLEAMENYIKDWSESLMYTFDNIELQQLKMLEFNCQSRFSLIYVRGHHRRGVSVSFVDYS
jgi:hypothetical protein